MLDIPVVERLVSSDRVSQAQAVEIMSQFLSAQKKFQDEDMDDLNDNVEESNSQENEDDKFDFLDGAGDLLGQKEELTSRLNDVINALLGKKKESNQKDDTQSNNFITIPADSQEQITDNTKENNTVRENASPTNEKDRKKLEKLKRKEERDRQRGLKSARKEERRKLREARLLKKESKKRKSSTPDNSMNNSPKKTKLESN